MQLKTILNKCHKFKHFIYTSVRTERIDEREVVEVEIRPRKGSRLICSGCNKEAPGYDKLDWRRFEFIPIWGLAVFFIYQMRRVQCPCCGVKVEKVPWANGKHELTILVSDQNVHFFQNICNFLIVNLGMPFLSYLF